MRYTINKINKGEDELILNYKEKNPEVEAVLLFMGKHQRKLIGRKNEFDNAERKLFRTFRRPCGYGGFCNRPWQPLAFPLYGWNKWWCRLYFCVHSFCVPAIASYSFQ